MATDISQRIALILNKAENTSNENERETFFAAAQQMATRAEIDLDVLRYQNREAENKKHSQVEMRNVEMGTKGNRGGGAYTELFVAIARVNDVRCLRNNVEVDAYGMPFDLDHTEVLFNVIVQQMVRDCIEYIDAGEWRGRAKSIHDARRSFYTGYRERIALRLKEAKRLAENEARDEYEKQGVSTDMVLADKKQRVDSVYWQDARGSGWSYTDRGSSRAARSAGDDAGKNARIRKDSELAGRGALEG